MIHIIIFSFFSFKNWFNQQIRPNIHIFHSHLKLYLNIYLLMNSKRAHRKSRRIMVQAEWNRDEKCAKRQKRSRIVCFLRCKSNLSWFSVYFALFVDSICELNRMGGIEWWKFHFGLLREMYINERTFMISIMEFMHRVKKKHIKRVYTSWERKGRRKWREKDIKGMCFFFFFIPESLHYKFKHEMCLPAYEWIRCISIDGKYFESKLYGYLSFSALWIRRMINGIPHFEFYWTIPKKKWFYRLKHFHACHMKCCSQTLLCYLRIVFF